MCSDDAQRKRKCRTSQPFAPHWGNLMNGSKNVKKTSGRESSPGITWASTTFRDAGLASWTYGGIRPWLNIYSDIHFKLYPKMIMLIHILVTHRAETRKIQRRKNHCTSPSLHCYHQDTWGDNLRRFDNRRSTWLLTMPWCLVQTT